MLHCAILHCAGLYTILCDAILGLYYLIFTGRWFLWLFFGFGEGILNQSGRINSKVVKYCVDAKMVILGGRGFPCQLITKTCPWCWDCSISISISVLFLWEAHMLLIIDTCFYCSKHKCTIACVNNTWWFPRMQRSHWTNRCNTFVSENNSSKKQ